MKRNREKREVCSSNIVFEGSERRTKIVNSKEVSCFNVFFMHFDTRKKRRKE